MRMVRSTLEEENGQFHAIVEQLPIPIVEAWINATTDATPVATEGTVSHRRQTSTSSTSEGLLMTSPDMSASHNLQNSASFTSEDLMITTLEASAFRPHQTPFMSESNVNIFQDEGEDPGAGLARIMSGFSGEFFVWSI